MATLSNKADNETLAVKLRPKKPLTKTRPALVKNAHTVEIVSDSGEGAQKCGQSFGSIAARMGIGIWTVEIIPAEIQPPARSIEGASGNRIRLASHRVTNGGDEADLLVALNDQVMLRRAREGELNPDCTILLEDKWKTHADPAIAALYADAVDEMVRAGFDVREIPMEEECLKLVSNARRGKNMFVLGMLCSVYCRDMGIARDQIALTFAKKSQKIHFPEKLWTTIRAKVTPTMNQSKKCCRGATLHY